MPDATSEGTSLQKVAEEYAALVKEASECGARNQFARSQIRALINSAALVRLGVNGRDNAVIEDVARSLARLL